LNKLKPSNAAKEGPGSDPSKRHLKQREIDSSERETESEAAEQAKMNEETHHKMSKKIAQLTKVIFHLHSKNEENSAMQTAIQNAYEKEMETLLNSANGVITR
jgi:uncharacterized protein YihD (DUF1040 family)